MSRIMKTTSFMANSKSDYKIESVSNERFLELKKFGVSMSQHKTHLTPEVNLSGLLIEVNIFFFING